MKARIRVVKLVSNQINLEYNSEAPEVKLEAKSKKNKGRSNSSTSLVASKTVESSVPPSARTLGKMFHFQAHIVVRAKHKQF